MDFIAVTNQILEMDKSGRVEETIPLIRDMLAQPFEVPQILFAGIVYSLSTTRVVTEEGEVKAKWEVCQIAQSRPISKSWSEFCEEHLRMGATLASKYKRVWEVFVTELGYRSDDLIKASISSLANAIGAMVGLSPREQVHFIDNLLGGKSVVYFIQCGEDGPIKIGQTQQHPVQRLQAFQCASPFALELLGFSADLDESSVHERFTSLRIRGEWYLSVAELLDFIEKECASR